jgi:Uma2 family endonuclease
MATVLPWGAPLTTDELDAMADDGHRHELVDGTLFVTPAPDLDHQRCVGALFFLLRAARPDGLTVLTAPFDFRPSPTTSLQPDLLVARDSDFRADRLERPPLLVVEVCSPSTRLYDLGTKRLAYEAAGVAAYWIVMPDGPSLTVLHLVDGRYVEQALVTGDEPYRAIEPFPVTVVPAAVRNG